MTPLGSASFDDARMVAATPSTPGGNDILQRFLSLRATSRRIAEPLSPEDMTAQSMDDASPAKWHLAHTTWFFETFLLLPRGEPPFDMAFQYLFNSYYEALGERQPRPHRGLITRPGVAEVMAYRDHVDAAVERVLLTGPLDAETVALMRLGFAHEEQHQELLLTDILHLFAQNRLRPAYLPPLQSEAALVRACTFTCFDGGVVEVGHAGEGFAFDSEGPRHQVLLRPYRLADRMVTNAEWLAFMQDGGYARPDLWLSDGWSCCRAEGWAAPLYWSREHDEGWRAFGLRGVRPLDPAAPVVHVSFYEADAYARWSGARLPLEAEWEHAALNAGDAGAFLEDGDFEPRAASGSGLVQMFGDAWEWTASPYVAYPGFKPAAGAVGEYNGKFMINQMVLRGGSCVTAAGHVRPSYRNFFQPHQRWQFSGVRLARD